MKQIIVIRRDLKMRRGKEIVQGCHASIGAIEGLDPITLDQWKKSGSKKICVQVPSGVILLQLATMSRERGLPYYLVMDSALTEFEQPTITALAIGPDTDTAIDSITKSLELY